MGFVTEQHEAWKAKQDEDAGQFDPNYVIARDNAADDTDPSAPVDQSAGEPDPNTAGESDAPEGYEEQSAPPQ